MSSFEAVRQVYAEGGVSGLATSIKSSYESYPSNYIYALPADGKSCHILSNTLLTHLVSVWYAE